MKKTLARIVVVIAALLLPILSSATTTTVPHFLNYQSLLYDDGGNLVTDGPADVTFRITDGAGDVQYEERQTLDVIHGAVSALVGNGLDGTGAPMGGIPASVFTPDSSRYLEVTVDGFPPESGLEIVAVPYSIYAEKALSVTDEAITGAMLAKKSISMDHLADGLIDQLAGEMASRGTIATRTDLTNMQTSFRSVTGAGGIGVNGGFVYSGSTNIQGVLQDLDRSLQRRQAEIDAHASAKSGVHGVAGDVVGTMGMQTLINKTLETPIIQGGMTVIGGNVIMTGGSTITGLPAPSGPNDAATLSYVDNAISAEATARQTADAAETATRSGYDTNHENRIHALEVTVYDRQNTFMGSAWGTVNCTGPFTYIGGNISVANDSFGLYDISFNTPMANANYAVALTPSDPLTIGGYTFARPFTISAKTVNGFTVNFGMNPLPASFDFIVMGS